MQVIIIGSEEEIRRVIESIYDSFIVKSVSKRYPANNGYYRCYVDVIRFKHGKSGE